MKFLKIIFSLLVPVLLSSCLSNDELGIEQYYENRDNGIAFLAANKSRETVKETASGLQYEELSPGEGATALARDIIKARYKYSLIDGTVVYDSQSLELDEIGYAQVNLFLNGITEGLQLMNLGSTYKFYIPYQLAYNEQMVGAVEPFSVLVLEVEMLKIGNEDSEFLKENSLVDGVFETDSGLQYEILTEGEGVSANDANYVRVNYTGTLIDGTQFDSTFVIVDDELISTPVTFNLGTLIPGFSESVRLMNEGSKYKVYIPFYLGYGSTVFPDIPAFSTLIFEIELLEIIN